MIKVVNINVNQHRYKFICNVWLGGRGVSQFCAKKDLFLFFFFFFFFFFFYPTHLEMLRPPAPSTIYFSLYVMTRHKLEFYCLFNGFMAVNLEHYEIFFLKDTVQKQSPTEISKFCSYNNNYPFSPRQYFRLYGLQTMLNCQRTFTKGLNIYFINFSKTLVKH